MKRLFCTILIAACAALAFSSCEALDPDKDFDGTPFGFWVVDKLEVETEVTVNGTTNTHTSTTDFSDVYGRLILDPSHIATVWCNLDSDLETFAYDESTRRITFKESLNAGDKLKAIILLGVYDVTLEGDKMILQQPEFSIGGSVLGAKERSTYTLHRAPKSEQPKEANDKD